jgi:O-antigen/teichoic acid export membrane protein
LDIKIQSQATTAYGQNMPPGLHHSRRQTILNAITSWADMLCQGVMGLLLVPLLIERLGKDGFGLVCLLNVIVVYSSFADLGIRGALGRDLSALAAQGDKRGFTTLLTMAAMILLTIAGVLTCGFYLFRAPLARALQIPTDLTATAQLLIPAYCGGMAILGFLTPVFASAVSAINRFDSVNVIRAAITLAGNFAMLLLLPGGSNAVVWWCSLVLVTQAALLLVTFCAFVYHCRPLLSFTRIASFAPLVSLMHFGSKVFGLAFAGMMGTQTDPLILSAYLGPGAVAIYNPATRISAMIRPMVLVLANTLYPQTTQHHVTDDTERLKAVLLKGTRYTMLLGALATVTLLCLADAFSDLWLRGTLGKDALGVSSALKFIALIDAAEYAAGTQWPIMLAKRRINFLLSTQIIFSILNICLSIFLVGFTNAGVSGVFIGTLCSSALRRPLIIWHAAATCGIPLSHFIAYSYLPAGGVAALLAPFGVAVVALNYPTTWITLVVNAFFMLIYWTILTLAIGLCTQDRQRLRAACMAAYKWSRHRILPRDAHK